MNAFNFGPSFSTIALYSVSFDSDNTFSLTLLPALPKNASNHKNQQIVSVQQKIQVIFIVDPKNETVCYSMLRCVSKKKEAQGCWDKGTSFNDWDAGAL